MFHCAMSTVQAWRDSLVAGAGISGFTAPSQLGACRDGANTDHIIAAFDASGLLSLRVQCAGVLSLTFEVSSHMHLQMGWVGFA